VLRIIRHFHECPGNKQQLFIAKQDGVRARALLLFLQAFFTGLATWVMELRFLLASSERFLSAISTSVSQSDSELALLISPAEGEKSESSAFDMMT